MAVSIYATNDIMASKISVRMSNNALTAFHSVFAMDVTTVVSIATNACNIGTTIFYMATTNVVVMSTNAPTVSPTIVATGKTNSVTAFSIADSIYVTNSRMANNSFHARYNINVTSCLSIYVMAKISVGMASNIVGNIVPTNAPMDSKTAAVRSTIAVSIYFIFSMDETMASVSDARNSFIVSPRVYTSFFRRVNIV